MTSNFSNIFICFLATPTAQFEVNFHKSKKNAALTNHKKTDENLWNYLWRYFCGCNINLEASVFQFVFCWSVSLWPFFDGHWTKTMKLFFVVTFSFLFRISSKLFICWTSNCKLYKFILFVSKSQSVKNDQRCYICQLDKLYRYFLWDWSQELIVCSWFFRRITRKPRWALR